MLGHECRHAWLVPDSMRFPGERGVERTPAMRMPQRRFPAPWSVEETDTCFIVRDVNGQAQAWRRARLECVEDRVCQTDVTLCRTVRGRTWTE
jgi:hypothetical protein